ncbi:MAG: DUF5672 family protein [Candidatus Ozemobacteraceae bacterium]
MKRENADPPVTSVSPQSNPLVTAIELQQQGKLAEAETLFRQILVVAPTNPVALYSLSVILIHSGRPEEALQLATTGTDANPDFAQLWFAFGSALQALHRREEALVSYDRALAANPKFIEVLINSGALLRDMHRHLDSLERFRRVLEIDPEYEAALGNYGILLTEFKQGPLAVSAFERLLRKNPKYPFGLGLLCYERMHLCDWTDLEATTQQITTAIREGETACKTLAYMALSDSASDHYLCARIYAKRQHPQSLEPLWQGEPYYHERIRIAYVSPDLREHPVGHLMAGVIEAHDKSRFETIGISLGVDDGSRIRARMIATFDHFIDAKDMHPRKIAELMRQMEVDIAIDLAGYTSDSKTDIFLNRPAPIQINYLGYPGTMGLDCYDYILADHTVIPEDNQAYFSEKVAYLEHCYLPLASGIEVTEPQSRSAYGLPDQGIVFCAFSHDYKIHPEMFAVWMRLLESNTDSVLWLMSRNEVSQKNLRQAAQSHGINPDRLVFATRVPKVEDHLARYRVADLFLDTWPYNAHTTASDALLVGLPVITYKGKSFPSRVAASLLATLGLNQLATDSFNEYFELANSLAHDFERLKSLKKSLSPAELHGHPFLGKSFTRSLEKALLDLLPVKQQPGNPSTKLCDASLIIAPELLQHGNLLQTALFTQQSLTSESSSNGAEGLQKSVGRVVILIPIYGATLNLLEQFSIDYLVGKTTGRKLAFIGPQSLDKTYYLARYKDIEMRVFEDRFFESIIGYNKLLLNAEFYRAFSQYDYMLIHQIDALMFHDNLDYWMERQFDYIGAPWPNGVEVNLKVGKFSFGNGVNLKSYVGNGGFSLRSIQNTIALLHEFEEIKDYWLQSGSSEDLFFAFMGMVSDKYRIPNQMIASRFSMELEPGTYFTMNNEEIPTGCHAWWKHDFEFWKKIIARVG